MVASVLWEDMYTRNHPSRTHPQAHKHTPQELQKCCTTEIPMKSGGTSVHLTFCQAHFWTQHVYMWRFLPFYLHCLLHRGSISPSYFSQITGVIAEKWFVPVPFLYGSGKRGRRTAKAAFAACCLSCSAFTKIVTMRVQCTCVSIYVTWRGSKSMLQHWSLMGPPPSRSTPLANAKSGWETVGIHGAECGKGQAAEVSQKIQAICISL